MLKFKIHGKYAAAALLGLCAAAWGLEQNPAVFQDIGKVNWMISNTMPMGAEFHLIYEDKKTGAMQILARLPAHYKLPPHSHSYDETLMVLKGKLLISIGGQKMPLEPGGSYVTIPAGTNLSLENTGWGPCILFTAFNGPFDVKGLPPAK